jgi:hypothetical protein
MSVHDYIARYQHQSHQQLYNSLEPADPHSLEATSDAWHTTRQRLHDLAALIQQDVSELMRHWSGPAGAEFEQRLHTVTAFSRDVAGSAGQVSDGLSRLVGPVHTAKTEARTENPADTNDNDKAVTLGVVGAIAGGPIGAGIGAFFGHKADEAEKEKARQRMLETIGQLAAAYDVTTHQTWPKSPATAPHGLPGSAVGGGAGTAAAPASGHLGSPGATNSGTEHTTHGSEATLVAGPGPGSGHDVATHTVIDGGVSTGPDASVLIGAAAVAAVGLAGAVPGAIPGPALTTGGSRTPASSLLGKGGGVKGVLGKEGGAAVDEEAAARARRADAPPPVEDDEEAARRRAGRSGAPGPEEEGHGSRGGVGRAENGSGGRNAVAARGLTSSDDEDEDERLTWLTEDDMSWSGAEPTPPPVLGSVPS